MVQSPASYLIHTARYSALKTSSDLPDIHVNWCFRSEMVLQFSFAAAIKTVFYFKVGKGRILASYEAFSPSTNCLQRYHIKVYHSNSTVGIPMVVRISTVNVESNLKLVAVRCKTAHCAHQCSVMWLHTRERDDITFNAVAGHDDALLLTVTVCYSTNQLTS